MKSATTLLLLAGSSAAVTAAALGGGLAARQEDSVFEWVNFNATALFKSEMEYRGEVTFGPYSARCASSTSDYTQCSDASGVRDFPVQSCANGEGSNDGGFSWQLNMASGRPTSDLDGWNLEVTATGVNGEGGDPIYGCKFFPRSAVVCNDTNDFSQYPVAYLDVPSSFTMQFQTTSGCEYDYFTPTASAPPATATPQAQTTSA